MRETQKAKIVVIENSVDITGGLTSISRSCVALRDSFEFVFVIPKGSACRRFIMAQGFSVHELPMLELKKNILTLLLYFPVLISNCFAMNRLLKRLRADLVVSNDIYNLLPAWYKFLGGRIPYIVYVRFLPSKFPRLLVSFWCFWNSRFASATIAVSKIVMRELPYKKNVHCIGGELPDSDKPYRPPTSNRILYIANYIQGKGHDLAIRSFALSHKQHPNWKLRFVGGDMGLDKNRRYKQDLIEMATNAGLAGAVEWNEFATDTVKEYEESAFTLNLSESESFSLTCLESLFYGRPVIATKCGGPAEIIDDRETGILVELDDVEGTAAAIDFLITHPVERDQMSLKAYERVRQKYSYRNTIGRLKELYDSYLLK